MYEGVEKPVGSVAPGNDGGTAVVIVVIVAVQGLTADDVIVSEAIAVAGA